MAGAPRPSDEPEIHPAIDEPVSIALGASGEALHRHGKIEILIDAIGQIGSRDFLEANPPQADESTREVLR